MIGDQRFPLFAVKRSYTVGAEYAGNKTASRCCAFASMPETALVAT